MVFLDPKFHLELSNTGIFNSKPQKNMILTILQFGVEKRTLEWFLPFGTLRTFWSVENNVQKA
jgi:hypothetical protein